MNDDPKPSDNYRWRTTDFLQRARQLFPFISSRFGAPVSAMTHREKFIFYLDRTGCILTLMLPLFLTHGRALAEIDISAISVLFVLHASFQKSGWAWVHQTWFRCALIWWAWQLICTLPPLGPHTGDSVAQATLTMRFVVFIAALQVWTLRDAKMRQWMVWILLACASYITFQVLFQAITGHNLFGVPRSADGTLTGPYKHSRAAAPLSRLAPPVLMFAVAVFCAKWRGWQSFLPSVAVTLLAMITLVVAGQRMPTVLLLFGILLCAALFRPYRWAGLGCLALTPLVMLAVKFFSHRSTDHLVTLAEQQLSHFSQSHYGLIYTRVWEMVTQNPVTGLGYDAFRYQCRNPAFFHGIGNLGQPFDGGGAAICVQHAHNHYAQALSNAGWPGLIFFTVMVVTLAIALWPRRGARYAWRVGLFVAFILQEWPIASTSDFVNLPLGGWAFLLVGVGLAEARNIVGVKQAEACRAQDATHRDALTDDL